MKLRHNFPAHALASDPISSQYQAEVDRATNQAQTRYERLERRLAREEARLEKARSLPSTKKRRNFIAELEALIELRRQELLQLHRLMNQSNQSAQHRGTKRPHRHVPSSEVF